MGELPGSYIESTDTGNGFPHTEPSSMELPSNTMSGMPDAAEYFSTWLFISRGVLDATTKSLALPRRLAEMPVLAPMPTLPLSTQRRIADVRGFSFSFLDLRLRTTFRVLFFLADLDSVSAPASPSCEPSASSVICAASSVVSETS